MKEVPVVNRRETEAQMALLCRYLFPVFLMGAQVSNRIRLEFPLVQSSQQKRHKSKSTINRSIPQTEVKCFYFDFRAKRG